MYQHPEPSLKRAVELLQQLMDADTGCGCCTWDDSWTIAADAAKAFIREVEENDPS